MFERDQNVYVRDLVMGSAHGAKFVQFVDGQWAWIDLCMIGQHLPQRYNVHEIKRIDSKIANELGLCPNCLGYGTLDVLPFPATVSSDQLKNPCPKCDGSGKEFIRLQITRTETGSTGTMIILEHPYLGNAKKADDCYRCSLTHASHDAEITYLAKRRLEVSVEENGEAGAV